MQCDCLLSEVHERCKKGLSLATRLNNSLAFFCCDLLSIIEPRQVFELVSLYLDKFSGVCQMVLHDCKLTFLQIICDHDLFVEMPGRDPSDRNYLSSVLIQEIFLTWDHDDLSLRANAARILVVLLCKHEFDARYQKPEDKLYIAQLYFPLIGQILDEMPVFYNLNAVEKREVLIVILQIVRNLDDASLVKAWQQSIARTRLFFKLLEECLVLFEHRKPADGMLMGCSSRSPVGDGPASPKYSDRLSPAVNNYLSEASRQEVRPQGTPENGYLWQRVNSQLSSPSQPYSLREALAQAQSSRIGASAQALRESLHPILRQKLELWEENLSASVNLQVLEITEKFSMMAASHSISTDYGKLDFQKLVAVKPNQDALNINNLDLFQIIVEFFSFLLEASRVEASSRADDSLELLQTELVKREEALRVATIEVDTLQALLKTERQSFTFDPTMERVLVRLWHSHDRLREIARDLGFDAAGLLRTHA
nr:guanine nucleotide exchange factor SPIKE 1-like [Quercus suber]